jgi:hypothetical protein
MLLPKSEMYGLLLGVRAVPVASESAPLSDDEKAVLMVVLGYRRYGGVSRTRISEILRIDPAEALQRLCAARLIRADESGERVRWMPREETLLRLGYRAFSEIAAVPKGRQTRVSRPLPYPLNNSGSAGPTGRRACFAAAT